jgi:O-antigen ligase
MIGLLSVYALAAIGAVGGLIAPRVGLYVYIFFAVLRPHYLWGWAGSTAGLSQAVGIAMLIGWTIRGFGRWQFDRARSIVTALVMFAVWSALSSIQAEDATVAGASLVELGKIVLPFLVGVTILDGERDVRRMLWVIVAAQAYISYEMNVSYLGGYNRAQVEGYGGMDNNCLAISLVTTLGAAIALFVSSSRWTERGILAVSSALILHTVLLTFSRGALVGLLVVAGLGVVMMPKRPRYIVAALGLVLLAIRLTGPELAARYQSAFVETEDLDASAAGRLELWRDCLTIMATQPFFGVGPRNWPVVAASFDWAPGKEAHSVWMQTGAELGLPGVLMLLSFYILAILKLWRLVRRRPAASFAPLHGVAFGLSLAIVGYVTTAQFVSLVGLETPFYLVMVGVVLLRCSDGPAEIATAAGDVAPKIAAVPSVRPVRLATPARVAPPARVASPPRPANLPGTIRRG